MPPVPMSWMTSYLPAMTSPARNGIVTGSTASWLPLCGGTFCKFDLLLKTRPLDATSIFDFGSNGSRCVVRVFSTLRPGGDVPLTLLEDRPLGDPTAEPAERKNHTLSDTE